MTLAVSEAGKYYRQQQFSKVVELLEKELPNALQGGESCDFIAVYGVGYNSLGHAYLQLGKYEKAVEALKKTREVMAGWSAPYYLLGQAYARMNKPSESIANFQKGMELDPDTADYIDYTCLIVSYIEQNNKLAAEKILALAKKRFPEQMKDLSISQFEGFKVKANDINMYMNQAEVCYQSRDYNGAIENYRKVIQIDPIHKIAQYNLGKSLLMNGNSEDGVAECEKALALGLDDVNMYRTLGKEYLKKKDWAKALEMYENIKRLDPKDDSAYFACGVLYMGLRDGWKAREEFKKAVEINPDNAEAHYELARLYADYEPEYAKQELEKVLEINPDHKGAKEELKKLNMSKE
ncbi:MAG: tetratricopeptide repeat protein [Candidatus Omnitrophota bacterium]